MGEHVDNEVNMYRRMEQSPTAHPGRNVIRTLLDTFYIDGPQDKHRCLVHPPLWESVLAYLRRNPVERLPSPVIAVVLHRLFLALDYLHTECQIAHTGWQSLSRLLLSFAYYSSNQISRPIISCSASGMIQSLLTSRSLNFNTLCRGRRQTKTGE